MSGAGSTIKTAFKRHVRCKDRNREIDLALAVMCAIRQPGETFNYCEIAKVTGLSHGGAQHIAANAMRKIHRKLRFGSKADMGREIFAR